MRAPKRYECFDCGYRSSKCKVQRFTNIGFAVCYKCRGRVKETDEWGEWYAEQLDKSRKGNRA